jgi:hypothetical protein
MPTFEPKKLGPGWLKRCSVNSVRLLYRSPIAFLLAIGLPVLLAEQTKFRPLLMLLGGVMLLCGTMVSFKADALHDKSWGVIASRVVKKPYLFLYAAIAVILLTWTSGPFFHQSEDVGIISLPGVATNSLILVISFFGLVQRLIDIAMLLLFKEHTRSRFPMHAVGMFSAHLTLEHGLDSQSAGALTSDAVAKNPSAVPVYCVILTLISIAPISLFIVIPFMYCLYREIFYGQGLALKKAAVRKDAPIGSEAYGGAT